MLPQMAIEEFQQLWKKKTGNELQFSDAELKANAFFQLFDLISRKNLLNIFV
jgi:hypothetical protein